MRSHVFSTSRAFRCWPLVLPLELELAIKDGLASAVLDWKSAVALTAEDVRVHSTQLRHHMAAIGVQRGALVYMTPSIVYGWRMDK